ncbi:MAG: methyltransferase [Bacillus sp. (in: firmicutes)]|uniref:methyltransferase n=1 Tax=Bacillus sp. TaxID=1409 RepID=UPI0039E5FA21
MKRYKIISATALTMMLATNASTCAFAEKKEITIQEIKSANVFSEEFMEQTRNLDTTSANNLNKAIQSTLLGPEIEKLKVFDHEFNVSQAAIFKMGNQTVVNGKMEHHLSYRPNDQIYYRFTKENGVIKGLEIKIERGGWTKITAPILTILAPYFGMTITSERLTQMGQQLGEIIDGKWENSMEAIIAAMSMYIE